SQAMKSFKSQKENFKLDTCGDRKPVKIDKQSQGQRRVKKNTNVTNTRGGMNYFRAKADYR
ncbi:hypothetical protein AC249_AIPGENE15328, partial [Exaiptasia diaphana]